MCKCDHCKYIVIITLLKLLYRTKLLQGACCQPWLFSTITASITRQFKRLSITFSPWRITNSSSAAISVVTLHLWLLQMQTGKSPLTSQVHLQHIHEQYIELRISLLMSAIYVIINQNCWYDSALLFQIWLLFAVGTFTRPDLGEITDKDLNIDIVTTWAKLEKELIAEGCTSG